MDISLTLKQRSSITMKLFRRILKWLEGETWDDTLTAIKKHKEDEKIYEETIVVPEKNEPIKTAETLEAKKESANAEVVDRPVKRTYRKREKKHTISKRVAGDKRKKILPKVKVGE